MGLNNWWNRKDRHQILLGLQYINETNNVPISTCSHHSGDIASFSSVPKGLWTSKAFHLSISWSFMWPKKNSHMPSPYCGAEDLEITPNPCLTLGTPSWWCREKTNQHLPHKWITALIPITHSTGWSAVTMTRTLAHLPMTKMTLNFLLSLILGQISFFVRRSSK